MNDNLKAKKTNSYLKRYWQLYVMLLLPLIHFLVFKYVPMFGNILAFRRYRPGLGPFGTEWVKFEYFKRFLKDAKFWRAFSNTLYISFLNLIINFPIPIIFAILINELKGVKFKKIIQTVSYMPRFISNVVIVGILSELLSPSSGIINRFLVSNFHIKPIYFLNEAKYFRPIYLLSEMWQFTGWTAIIYLAAITGVSNDMFEAAEIDGANRFQKIVYVTIPSIMPTIMVMLVLQIGRLLSVGFEKVLLLQSPSNTIYSDILDTLVYRVGILTQSYSLSTAMGLFSGIIGLILVSSSNYFSKKITGESVY